MKRNLAAFCVVLSLLGCQSGSDRIAGGADDHGNAIALRVQVEDSTGSPAAGMRVTVRPESWNPAEGSAPIAVVTSGPDGSCKFEALAPGAYRVLADDGNTMSTGTVLLESTTSIRLNAYAPGSIRGRLEGGGHGGVLMSIAGTDLVSPVGDSGTFRFDRVPAGNFRLTAGTHAELTLDRIPVLPRILSRLDPIAFDPSRPMRIEPRVRLEADLAPPTVDPLPGSYPGPLRLVFKSNSDSDGVEIAFEDKVWIPIADAIQLGSSRCLRARSRRGGETSPETRDLCYTLP